LFDGPEGWGSRAPPKACHISVAIDTYQGMPWLITAYDGLPPDLPK